MRTNQKKRISLKTHASKNAVLRGMYETHFAGGDLYKESFSLVDNFFRILIGRNFIGWNSVKANCKNSSMFPIGWFNSRICFKNRFFIAGHGGIRTSNSSKYQDRFQIARLLSHWSRGFEYVLMGREPQFENSARFDEITICIISIDVSVSVY